MNATLRNVIRRLPFLSLAAVLAANSPAHTVTVTAMSATVTSWTTTYPSAGAPTMTYPGSWTMQAQNAEVLGLISSYSTGVSGSAASTDNVQYQWTFKWTPANGSDTPTGDIVLQERQQYTCEASCLGNSLDTAYAFVDWTPSLGSGLSPKSASIGIGTGTMVDNESTTGWLDGSNIVVLMPTWTLQTDGTYLTTVTCPSTYAFGCSGYQTSSLPSRKQCNMFGGYTIQATVISVDDVNFTPYG